MAGDLLRLAGIPETAWLRQEATRGGAEHPALSAGLDGAGDGGASAPVSAGGLRTGGPAEPPGHSGQPCMGMGTVRGEGGDILVSPESADLIVLDTVADFLLSSWNSAGRARLTVTGDPRRPPPHPGGAVRGGAGHGQLPAAGRGVFHRFSGWREGRRQI